MRVTDEQHNGTRTCISPEVHWLSSCHSAPQLAGHQEESHPKHEVGSPQAPPLLILGCHMAPVRVCEALHEVDSSPADQMTVC